jgi:hypothetical protein
VTAAALRRDPGNALNALARRARRTSHASLIALEAAGLTIALTVWVLAPGRWQLALPCLAVSAFGLWGLADKVIAAGGRRMDPLVFALLRVFQIVVAACGVAAAAVLGYLIVGRAIGTVIS